MPSFPDSFGAKSTHKKRIGFHCTLKISISFVPSFCTFFLKKKPYLGLAVPPAKMIVPILAKAKEVHNITKVAL